jgi:hypothetical protein
MIARITAKAMRHASLTRTSGGYTFAASNTLRPARAAVRETCEGTGYVALSDRRSPPWRRVLDSDLVLTILISVRAGQSVDVWS